MDISAYQHMNIRMSTRGKRPLRNLTPNDKVRAIQRIHNGETKASVSRDIGVPESTLRGWCKNEQKLRFMCRQLGTDHLGLSGMDTPPEKRAKFGGISNFDELSFGSLPMQAIDYASHNESILENYALVEFLKKNALQTDAMQQHTTSSDADPPSMGYGANNMVHQLNLLALLNTKLPHKLEQVSVANLTPSSTVEISVSAPVKKLHCPLLSVKNWAKDPAKQDSIDVYTCTTSNDKNNNDIDAIQHATSNGDNGPVSTMPESSFALGNGAATIASPDNKAQGTALLDWCKMFSASLNFFAFAAAAASMHPSASSEHVALPTPVKADETQRFNNILLNKLSPLVNSDSSNGSYYDSEPEDLSVRSCASKASSPCPSSSPSNSRSQSPDKNSTSSASTNSDGEQ
ncbi:danr [Drosophila busckii]|uniref:Danr n=1 Tax=Drosophila busckii TaxID=30019 RepID=A0A0M5JD22_DROBS|nr:protein distal antenna-related [Drosophila busckii]ALC47931.1 danr [Drosophila busckii]